MAEIHKNLGPMSGEWTEATGPLEINVGAEWVFETTVDPVEALETDAPDPPGAGVVGQPMFPGTVQRVADRLKWTREAGRYLWFRGSPDAVVVAAPA